jgi:hypothetical protein
MYDPDIVDGPATTAIVPELPIVMQGDDDSFTTTATFIHPYEFSDDDHSSLPEKSQTMSSFDFDALPRRGHSGPQAFYQPLDYGDAKIKIKPEVSSPPIKSLSPLELLTRMQESFSVKWDRIHDMSSSDMENQTHSRGSSFGLLASSSPPPSKASSLRRQLRKIKAVPVFAEMTFVLSPIIVRGQWEIVLKSTIIGFVLACTILGCLLAIPPHH